MATTTREIAAPHRTLVFIPQQVQEHVPSSVYAVLFASACVLIGVLWDISWHQSIGRDSFFSPPHVAIYLGGVVAGVACGLLVLRITLRGTPAERARSVTFWKVFRGPLGAWVCIWGAIAMITSAPFDDWWHAAYGLDTKILSPPHALLAAGIGAINVGALLMVLPLQNRSADAEQRRRFAWMVGFASGLLLLMLATVLSEYHYRIFMHGSRFYVVAAIAFPVVLAAATRAADLRWGATLTAGVYTATTLLMMWILPIFPAEAKLAPIYIQVTHMVPPSFPLLVIAPAVLMDLIMQRFGGDRRQWALAVALGGAFFVAFLVAQWPFASFLMSDYAQNPVFAADNFPYQVPKTTYYFRREFLPLDADGNAMRIGLLTAFAASMVSARLGLAWGAWLSRVSR
jgi:hypothetical protein